MRRGVLGRALGVRCLVRLAKGMDRDAGLSKRLIEVRLQARAFTDQCLDRAKFSELAVARESGFAPRSVEAEGHDGYARFGSRGPGRCDCVGTFALTRRDKR